MLQAIKWRSDRCGSTSAPTLRRLGGTMVLRRMPRFIRDAVLSSGATSESSDVLFDDEQHNKIQDWLGNTSGTDQDPESLGPFTDWPLPASKPSDHPENCASLIRTHASSPQPKHFSSLPQLRSNTTPSRDKSLRRLSSPLPFTQKQVKHVRFDDTITMYSTTQARGGTAKQDTTRAQEAPGRGPSFHTRMASLPHQQRPSGLAQLYDHGRNRSISASNAHQQLDDQHSPDRGRSLRKKHDFTTEELLSPVPESARDHLGHMKTMTDMIYGGNGELAGASQPMQQQKLPSKAAKSPSAPAREIRRPAPIDLSKAREYVSASRPHTNIQPVHNPITPDETEMTMFMGDDTSSVYTDGIQMPPYDEDMLSPLRIPTKSEMRGVNILQGYTDWRENLPAKEAVAMDDRAYQKSAEKHDDPLPMTVPNKQTSQEFSPLKRDQSPTKLPNTMIPDEHDVPPFTPLTPWLMGMGLGMETRRATKTLFGDKGWLEDTAAQAKPERQKPTSFLDNVKKTARKLAEKTEIKGTPARNSTAARELNVTLDPREQSLLYCEMEFTLSNALSTYINSQLHSGRLNPHILARISDAWAQKGRPKVIGFRYDLETQLDMVTEHISYFKFSGPYETNKNVIRGLLYGMKMNARVMRIRTFCQPDPVIAKHILDSQALLQLLDAPEQFQVTLEEGSQFFKAILEREQVLREKLAMKKSFTGYSSNMGTLPRNRHNGLASPKDVIPEQYRPNNQSGMQTAERNFSGPILEPTVYTPSRRQFASRTGESYKQQYHGA
ncbi:hypothetical protein F5Y04DRAFT_291958 [Hypomontagnella monticulosa]|nr:hypothetical protein F5Y04DRAFT_291958 [Hypomontagnella monticulosa]